MKEQSIPFLLMRGGTSRGPYFLRDDLPSDQNELSKILVSVIGAGHPLNIDGIGGGNAVTTKVAMLSRSKDDWADVDYFFAQVSVLEAAVDYRPTCGNILAGVGPAAIEMGLVDPVSNVTEIKIRAVNTGARIIAKIQTPNQRLSYVGDEVIDGVPGSSAPIELLFLDVAGSSTGQLFPSGNLIDLIDDIEVTCMDLAMPMVIAKAQSFGLTGHESCEELDNNQDFFTQMEQIRLKASVLMGMGDASRSVTPKFGLLSESEQTGHIVCRYFMPWQTHPSLAVTGSQCLASCALTPGTIADGMMKAPDQKPSIITLHHPMGTMDVIVDYSIGHDGEFIHHSAGLKRTARKLASGQVFPHPMQ